jgi:hypothetical protein
LAKFAQLVSMTFPDKLKEWMKVNHKTTKVAAYDLGVPRRTLISWMYCHHEPHPDRQRVIEEKMAISTVPLPTSPECIEDKSKATPASPLV